ncbi:MAG: methyltransferase type 11, partial [Acidimicrobiia bacterium]|nr:methyltransferase type 11 [Acidimicrobiia bacterium]
TAVDTARRAGFEAFTPEAFAASSYARPARFDSLLLAHVVEHMAHQEAADLIGAYLPFVRPGGHVILIAPQEAGFRSDDTHVEYMDEAALSELLDSNGVTVTRHYSFPFPRMVGRWFRYNEFVTVGAVPA